MFGSLGDPPQTHFIFLKVYIRYVLNHLKWGGAEYLESAKFRNSTILFQNMFFSFSVSCVPMVLISKFKFWGGKFFLYFLPVSLCNIFLVGFA